MKSCPRCGKQYPDTEGFCETDGTVQEPWTSVTSAQSVAGVVTA